MTVWKGHDFGPLPTVAEMNPWRKAFPRMPGTRWWFYGYLYGRGNNAKPKLEIVEIRGFGPPDDIRCVYVANGGFVYPSTTDEHDKVEGWCTRFANRVGSRQNWTGRHPRDNHP